MPLKGILTASLLVPLILVAQTTARAQEYNVLEECTALSNALDDIHGCLDNYLDIMDNNLAQLTEYLQQSLSGEALAGLQRSQQAFSNYRRQNCLWYLEFSSPRIEAEQIAKNCLARMSQQRWVELQALVSDDNDGQTVLSGYYVYGPGRNSFQLCGSEEKLWLAGNPTELNNAQQLYLSLAQEEFDIIHAQLSGKVNTRQQPPADHQGVFDLEGVVDMSLPGNSDCSIPSNLAEAGNAFNTQLKNRLSGEENTDEEAEGDAQDEPEQQLTAYFGAWLVDCIENNGDRRCRLEVALLEGETLDTAAEDEDVVGSLMVVRQQRRETDLELVFPEREIDTPARIRWRVDQRKFGDLVGSEIRVDELATRQLVPGNNFVYNELFPEMLRGASLHIEVLASVDDTQGEPFVATLNGLTRAVAFADDFVREGS